MTNPKISTTSRLLSSEKQTAPIDQRQLADEATKHRKELPLLQRIVQHSSKDRASIKMPEEHFEVCGFYLKRSRRTQCLLDEGSIVNVAITADEDETIKVVVNVMIAVRTDKPKR
jgi:hypothetical protein